MKFSFVFFISPQQGKILIFTKFDRIKLISFKLAIGHFGKYHNTLCLSPQILHKHCLKFLLGLTVVRIENKNNAYAKFGGTNKEYYCIFRTGLWASFWKPQLVTSWLRTAVSIPFAIWSAFPFLVFNLPSGLNPRGTWDQASRVLNFVECIFSWLR